MKHSIGTNQGQIEGNLKKILQSKTRLGKMSKEKEIWQSTSSLTLFKTIFSAVINTYHITGKYQPYYTPKCSLNQYCIGVKEVIRTKHE